MKRITETSWFWGLYARCYDVLNVFPPYVAMILEVIKTLDFKPRKAYRVLDAGCGTGNLELILAEVANGLDNFELKVEAIDFSITMYQKAKHKLHRDDRFNFDFGNLLQPLNFKDASFDRIVSLNVIHALKNADMAFKEFGRILKPDGLIVLVILKKGYQMPLILKAAKHAGDPDEKWLKIKNVWQTLPKIYEAFNHLSFSERLLATFQFIFVAISNKIINDEVEGMELRDLRVMLRDAGLEIKKCELVYGGQDLLLVAEKINN
jgi:ubiquinone/menaquinone biosynthesis C-methylase UbiE